LGDSITWGYRDPARNGYRKDLWNRLYRVGMSADFTGSLSNGTMGDNNHEGHLNWRIDELSREIVPWLRTYKPDIVLLHIGTNDVVQDYDFRRAPARLSILIDQIRTVRPGAHIFVASLIGLRSSRPGAAQRRADFNAAVPGIVRSKGSRVHFVPQHLVGPENLVDSAHPSACGYAKMSFLWYYYMGRTSLNVTGSPWPIGYSPFHHSGGPCR
jgi:lysophospholipase L1-like esterase